MKYYLIGDKVFVPRLKVIGTITDKMYDGNSEELKIKVKPDNVMSNTAFQQNIFTDDEYWTEYNKIRSMDSINFYRSKTIKEESTDINSLNIPNLLRKKDIIRGVKVRLVDNYFLERMISYNASSRLFTLVRLTDLYKKGKITLTGRFLIMDNGEIAVTCRFENDDTYYIYMSCLQVIKKMNIFRKIWNFLDDNKGLIPLFIWSISVLIVAIVTLIVKLV